MDMTLRVGADIEMYLSRKHGVLLATTKVEQKLSKVQIRNGRFSAIITNPTFQTREIWISGYQKDLVTK